MVVISIFSFSQNVRQNVVLCGNGLNVYNGQTVKVEETYLIQRSCLSSRYFFITSIICFVSRTTKSAASCAYACLALFHSLACVSSQIHRLMFGKMNSLHAHILVWLKSMHTSVYCVCLCYTQLTIPLLTLSQTKNFRRFETEGVCR